VIETRHAAYLQCQIKAFLAKNQQTINNPKKKTTQNKNTYPKIRNRNPTYKNHTQNIHKGSRQIWSLSSQQGLAPISKNLKTLKGIRLFNKTK